MSTWIPTSEAARLCGVSQRTVQKWVVAGKVKGRTVARGRRQISQVRRDSLPASGEQSRERDAKIANQANSLSDGAESVREDRETGRESFANALNPNDPTLAALEERLAAAIQGAMGAVGERLAAQNRAQEEKLLAAVRAEVDALRSLPAPQTPDPAMADDLRALREITERQADELRALRDELAAATKPRPWWAFWRR